MSPLLLVLYLLLFLYPLNCLAWEYITAGANHEIVGANISTPLASHLFPHSVGPEADVLL